MSHSFEVASETLRVSTLMTDDPLWLYKIKNVLPQIAMMQ